jgi:hypothetical protein
MTEERKFAILFAATILSTRKLIDSNPNKPNKARECLPHSVTIPQGPSFVPAVSIILRATALQIDQRLVRSAHAAAITCASRSHLFLSLKFGDQDFRCQH